MAARLEVSDSKISRIENGQVGATPRDVRTAYEVEAASIRIFSPMILPGLLQTADYARAIISPAHRPRPGVKKPPKRYRAPHIDAAYRLGTGGRHR